MTNRPPQFETDDELGTTDPYTGTVGTSPVSIPTVAGGTIAQIFVKQPLGTSPYNKILYFSLDAGTNWHELRSGESTVWPLRGDKTQIQIKGSTAGTAYEVILNREDP